jgi:hypothetical protein
MVESGHKFEKKSKEQLTDRVSISAAVLRYETAAGNVAFKADTNEGTEARIELSVSKSLI